jgi:hypothetical protein
VGAGAGAVGSSTGNTSASGATGFREPLRREPVVDFESKGTKAENSNSTTGAIDFNDPRIDTAMVELAAELQQKLHVPYATILQALAVTDCRYLSGKVFDAMRNAAEDFHAGKSFLVTFQSLFEKKREHDRHRARLDKKRRQKKRLQGV